MMMNDNEIPGLWFANKFDEGRADSETTGRIGVDVNGAAGVALVVERCRHQ